MHIKVLGPGCQKCQKTFETVEKALSEKGVEAKVEKVTGMLDIAAYGVFGTPALVIDEQVKMVGKVPTKEEVMDLLD